MKRVICSILLLVTVIALAAQGRASDIDQWLMEKPEQDAAQPDTVVTNDLIQVNYAKKDARKAMLMSLLLPGAGQYYADKSSITTYIFPALELTFIGGIIYYTSRGNDKTDDFERYANGEIVEYVTQGGTIKTGTRYNRQFQWNVQEVLKGQNEVDIYDNNFFRLDGTDTQHFYEDIGKYPHYVFGWIDWYYRFAADESGTFQNPDWKFDGELTNPNTKWLGNFPLWGDTSNYISPSSKEASTMRNTYVALRDEAKGEYAWARGFTFALAANHLLSGLDAVRLTRKVNRMSISQIAPQMNIYTAMHEGELTPMLGFKWDF